LFSPQPLYSLNIEWRRKMKKGSEKGGEIELQKGNRRHSKEEKRG
jgi:hypothetical protein